jgi:NAD+ diphosphatase
MKHRPLLDRAAHLRSEPEALARERARPDALFTPVWRGRSLLVEADPPRAGWLPLDGRALPEPVVFLGHDVAGRPRFAADVSDAEDPGFPGRFVDLVRAGARLDGEDLEALAYARGMMHWHRSAAACARCGATAMRVLEGGFKRVCLACETSAFPRTDPAVMVLVTRGDRALLARQARFPADMYSALAGFVEPGESLEQCVVRETKEEVGLEVEAPRYFGSQPWPFPQSLMVGFRAEATSDALTLDETELEAARWVSKEELANPRGFFYPPPMSLAHHLIRAFLTA